MPGVSDITVDRGTIKTVLTNLDTFESKLRQALQIVTDAASKKMTNWAKENAIWTDRTSNARQKLSGDGYWESNYMLTCAVMHNMDYGVWLELAHAKKYAILEQAIESQKDTLIKQYVKLLGG